MQAESPLGTTLDGRYLIEERLGNGTIGVVYRARDVALDRPVAVKLVDARSFADRRIEHFQREARALACVRHENVVQVHAFGQHDARHYLAMELVEGRSLEAMIEEHAARGGTVPLDLGIRIVRAVASGLSAVHARGMVHRDVKPSNIVVEEGTLRPVLIDFGLARHLSRVARVTIAGGTPCYMAPEQARDPASVSAASDIYGLACTAFELITGRCVFEADDLVELLRAHAEAEPPRLSTFGDRLEPFDAVFSRALAKSPRDRYATCEAFVEAFDAAVALIEQGAAPRNSYVRSRGRTAAPDANDPSVASVPLRVLVLHSDDADRRHLVRALESALRAAGDDVVLECVESERRLVSALTARPADIIVIDDDTVLGRAGRFVENLRQTPRGAVAELVVLSGESASTSSVLPLLRDDVAIVPKPVNQQVLRAVVGKVGCRVAQRRARRRAKLVDTKLIASFRETLDDPNENSVKLERAVPV